MSIQKKLLIMTICCCSAGQLYSQQGPSTGDPNEGGKPGAAPISGIEILIGLGGLLGAKKVFDLKRKTKG